MCNNIVHLKGESSSSQVEKTHREGRTKKKREREGGLVKCHCDINYARGS